MRLLIAGFVTLMTIVLLGAPVLAEEDDSQLPPCPIFEDTDQDWIAMPVYCQVIDDSDPVGQSDGPGGATSDSGAGGGYQGLQSAEGTAGSVLFKITAKFGGLLLSLR